MRTPSAPDRRPPVLIAEQRGADDAAAHGAPIVWHPVWHSALATPVAGSEALARRLYAQALAGVLAREGEPLALSLKLPFCAAHCLCCDRPIHAAQPADVIENYVSQLIDEARLLAAQVGGGRDLLQLHLGGGTVNELTESQLVRLVMALQGAWRLPRDAELSVECDPRRASWGLFELLRGLGFDRVTLGVLDLDRDVQRAIGRQHSAALVDDACQLARASGFGTVELDVMVGLPAQTPERWQATIERLVAMAPERVVLSRYRHRPWLAPGQQAIDVHLLPDAATAQAMAVQASRLLRDAGYRWIGADRYVLESDELSLALDEGRLRRSLIGYTGTPATPLLGLGCGALGEIDGSLFWNEDTLDGWRSALRAGHLPMARARIAEGTDLRRRLAAEQLLCTQELGAASVAGGLEDAWQQLARHEPGGQVRVLQDRIVVTEAGRHQLLALCAEVALPRWLS